MKNIIIPIVIFVFLLSGSSSLMAQRDIKNAMIPKKDLPKLEKVMIIGDEKGVIHAPDAESYGPHISDSEATNRSVSDGKISRREQAIIDRAKRMPQER